VPRYDLPLAEAAYARFDRFFALCDSRRVGDLSERNEQDSVGANFRGDDLHDDMQRPGGNLSNHLPYSICSGSERAQQQRPSAAEHPC
jgi:hypothetical protein